jgi:chromate transporter
MVELARFALFGFGGVGPQAFHFFVEDTGWLDADDFAGTFSLAQALPGANVVNLCAIVGDRWFGPVGALAAVCAITVPPLILVIAAATVLAHVTRAPRLLAAESAVVAASAGLILATAYRLFATIIRGRMRAIVIALGVAAAVGVHALSMPLTTLGALGVGVASELIARRRG